MTKIMLALALACALGAEVSYGMDGFSRLNTFYVSDKDGKDEKIYYPISNSMCAQVN